MVVLAHCKFVELLKTKANEYDNVSVTVVTEEFTSQTCLNCKKRTKTSKELFVCGYCNLHCDRDILGSVNIFLKYL
jgi:transposase